MNIQNRFRPQVESLQDRVVPAVTFHGGQVMPHVELQGIYYGSDWSSNATLHNQAVQFENFQKMLVQSSYIDMLTSAGYGVGRGTDDPGRIYNSNINKSYYLTDGAIRSSLQSFISAGQVKQPDANRLYVVFVEPNVAIWNAGATSINSFLGYHGAFSARDSVGHQADVRYAVIAYPGGSVHNAGWGGLSAFNTMTVTASHEIAEAVTDPDVNYKRLAWYDDRYNGEVGAINRHLAQLNGYIVQTIINKNDQAMYPSGSFVVTSAPSTGSAVFFQLTTTFSRSTDNRVETLLPSTPAHSIVDHIFALESKRLEGPLYFEPNLLAS